MKIINLVPSGMLIKVSTPLTSVFTVRIFPWMYSKGERKGNLGKNIEYHPRYETSDKLHDTFEWIEPNWYKIEKVLKKVSFNCVIQDYETGKVVINHHIIDLLPSTGTKVPWLIAPHLVEEFRKHYYEDFESVYSLKAKRYDTIKDCYFDELLLDVSEGLIISPKIFPL